MTLPDDNGDDTPRPLSRTKKKKMAENLQKLGEDLSLLSVGQLGRLDLYPDLFKALVEAKSITSNVAARRHRQYIGTLMRQVDPEPILASLEQLKAAPAGLYSPKLEVNPQRDKTIQALLDRLLALDDDAMEIILSGPAQIDRQRLRQLIRNAIKDISKKKKNPKSLMTLKNIVIQSNN